MFKNYFYQIYATAITFGDHYLKRSLRGFQKAQEHKNRTQGKIFIAKNVKSFAPMSNSLRHIVFANFACRLLFFIIIFVPPSFSRAY